MRLRLGRCLNVYLLLTLEFLLLSTSYGGKKENETIKKKCETCKSFAKKFEEGMERTGRYMYEGGDADWEEKKLGSYASSEMRFIEITEGLCDSKEHDCNHLLESEEERLETWWKQHKEDDPDLFEWFCLENYRVCCPENTFGPDCEACPYGTERPCKGNGKCNGAGTRGGTGKCRCTAGYKGDLCDICKDGYYQEMKNETHTTCKVCHKACTALCTGPGPKGCKKCKAGWLWEEENGCQDVDECQAEEPPCDENEFCTNSQGSYKCAACNEMCDKCIGEGSDKCVKCKTGFEMKEDGCGDIDECEQEGTCKSEHMSCNNIIGSYYCDCADGYERMGGECIESQLLKAMNETGQASEESSENLESSTSQEGESDATETGGGTMSEENSIAEEKTGDNDNEQKILDEIANSNKNIQPGQEIPSSPGDLEDAFEQNDSESSQSKTSDTVQNDSETDKHIPGSQNSHEEL